MSSARPTTKNSRSRALALGLLAPALLGGCRLFDAPRDATRVASPGRTLASEADTPGGGTDMLAPPPAAAAPAAADEEPDLLPASTTDEPSDAAQGDGPAPPLSLDHRGGLPVASRYAGLDRASCEAELHRRHVSFERVGEARGVVAPLRLTGPLSGVTFRSTLPVAKRKTSTIEIYDCRLVLALDDFARLLTKHDVVEVIHLSVYRPVAARVPLKGAGRRHGGALAIDAAIFKTKDGRALSVEKDFHGRIGARPCPAPKTATELHQIACEASDARLFNVLLTPDYNWAHRNHFHLEVTAGVPWTLVR